MQTNKKFLFPKGIKFISESDSEIYDVIYPATPKTTLLDVAKSLANTKGKTQVIAPEEFFQSQTNPAIKTAVKTLQATTQNLTLFKTTGKNCTCSLTLLGFASPAQIIGMHTCSIET